MLPARVSPARRSPDVTTHLELTRIERRLDAQVLVCGHKSKLFAVCDTNRTPPFQLGGAAVSPDPHRLRQRQRDHTLTVDRPVEDVVSTLWEQSSPKRERQPHLSALSPEQPASKVATRVRGITALGLQCSQDERAANDLDARVRKVPPMLPTVRLQLREMLTCAIACDVRPEVGIEGG